MRISNNQSSPSLVLCPKTILGLVEASPCDREIWLESQIMDDAGGGGGGSKVWGK